VLGAEDDAIFAEVEGRAPAVVTPGELSGLRTLPVDEDLLAAEVDSIDETFDADDIELLADDAELEDDLDALGPAAAMAALRAESGPVAAALGVSVDEIVGAIDDDLVLPDASAADLLGDDFDLPDDLSTRELSTDEVDDLDDVDDALLDVEDETGNEDDLEGARAYGRAESALAAGQWASAAALFERAFNAGFDSAELHAHLAWCRWNADPTPEMGDHALQLLDYATSLEPQLDLVHGYRAAVLVTLGDPAGARQAARRALDLNPYNDVANDVVDRLG
jgi:tetratricopeptide (TPR) repeat protein